MTDTSQLTIEERLARIEARLAPTPLVLVPPITVGSLSNVPAPGSQIAAQWAQDVSKLGVHRFPSTTARDAVYSAAAAGEGAYCETADTDTLWRSNGTAWQRVMNIGGTYYQMTMTRSVATINTTLIGTNEFNLVPTINMPAMPAGSLLDLSAMVYFSQSAVGTGGSQVNFTDSNSSVGPIIGTVMVIEDRVQLQSYGLRTIGYSPPVNVAFPINLRAKKFGASNPANAFQSGQTVLSIVAYKP